MKKKSATESNDSRTAMKEAMFYEKRPNGTVICRLCPHGCHIVKGRSGFCRVRKNIDGVLVAGNYGVVTSLALDPIEKKPLYRFHPGMMILSVGSYGCNMKCPYCQNHSISQAGATAQYHLYGKNGTASAGGDRMPVTELLELAKIKPRNVGIAFTYNEPTLSIEYILDAAPLFKEAGFKIVLVTNGMINKEPLEALLPYLDAVNIDVKTFNADKYKKIGGNLNTVKKTVEMCYAAGVHVEITSLIVPDQNDSADEMRAQAQWLAGIMANKDRHNTCRKTSIMSDIILHITRFFPHFRMTNALPTPMEKLHELKSVAEEFLTDVVLGNI